MGPTPQLEKSDVKRSSCDSEDDAEASKWLSVCVVTAYQEHDSADKTSQGRVEHTRDQGTSPGAQLIPADTPSSFLDEEIRRAATPLTPTMRDGIVSDLGHAATLSSVTDNRLARRSPRSTSVHSVADRDGSAGWLSDLRLSAASRPMKAPCCSADRDFKAMAQDGAAARPGTFSITC